ncbi:MAG TPA: aminotransferase class I/II-fold pyridoxal phosphate-dependent enzyme [Patescibacteria group bacterium]|nr:aminotransferase class I/II-fold pyridoxal phosphate-dependent enzyme [Patescibacteria group bacterium]
MVKAIFDELAQSPMGRTLQKALDAVEPLPALSQTLLRIRDQMVPRIRSRLKEFRLPDDAQAVFDAAQEKPHPISLARSHSWYNAALPPTFKPDQEYTIDDLKRAALQQLAIREGIHADPSQLDVAPVSTMMMLRAIIGTTPPGTAVLGATIAWEGYAIAPAHEKRPFKTKAEDESWSDFIEKNFTDPASEVGTVAVTVPDSLTGRMMKPAELQELLDLSDKYNFRLVLNHVHATPGADGKLPEPQATTIAQSTNKNLVTIASATKQLMPYQLPALEKSNMNIYYSPDPALVAEIAANVASRSPNRLTAPEITAGVALFSASDENFYARNQQASLQHRDVIEGWLKQHPGVSWYNDERPDTGYHAVLTFKCDLLSKAGVKTPNELYDYILFSTGVDPAPIFDSGPGWAKNEAGDSSLRMNYSLPEKELKLVLDLMDVAIAKMERGVTLQQVYQESDRPGGTRLRADETAAKAGAEQKAPPPPQKKFGN